MQRNEPEWGQPPNEILFTLFYFILTLFLHDQEKNLFGDTDQ